MNVECRYCAY